MQLVLVSSGLRVFSLGRTDGNAVLLVMPCSCSVLTGRSLSRDELMAEVGGCMEETAPAAAIPASVAGGTLCMKSRISQIRNHTPGRVVLRLYYPLVVDWFCEVFGEVLGSGALPLDRIMTYEALARSARSDNTLKIN